MKLSIVTINYNNIVGLEETIGSINKQIGINKKDFEYIVIDGLSGDGSQNIIKQSNIITGYKIEKDDGIADAFNKGISLASGEYLYFLNSGDIFYNENSLSNLINKLETNNCSLLIGKVAMVNNNNEILMIVGEEIDFEKQVYRNYLPHQGMLIKKFFFDKYGNYDREYRLGMDYEWSTRLIKDYYKLNIKFIDDVVCRMLEGGVSQTRYMDTFMAYHKARVKNKIINKYYSYIISVFFIVRRSFGLWLKR
jgi:glycosyltransferase involved in cell wall biosynthesis